uniref:Aminotransferase-like plant mobile domain-containing protein n=1 Tax=Chenopodium quinoa TaxID=63459 RepID=A0A803N1Z0_CHEQI
MVKEDDIVQQEEQDGEKLIAYLEKKKGKSKKKIEGTSSTEVQDPIMDPEMLKAINKVIAITKSKDEIEVLLQPAVVESKTEDETKRDKEHGADDGPKKKPHRFKQIARKNGNRSIDVKVADVHMVYGIPSGGKEIVDAKDGNEDYKEVLNSYKRYHGGVLPNNVNKLVSKLAPVETPLDDDWKRSFLVLVVNCCIKSIKNQQPYLRFLHTTINVNRISKYDWCSYTIESLIEWVLCWKSGVVRFFCGPLPFLWVCYFDRLQKMTLEQSRNFPLIKDTNFFASDWFGNMIDDVVKNVMMASIQDNPSPSVSPIQPLIFSQELTPPHLHVNEPPFDLDLKLRVDTAKVNETQMEFVALDF